MNEIEYLETVLDQVGIDISIKSSDNNLISFANKKHELEIADDKDIIQNDIKQPIIQFYEKINSVDKQDCELALASGLLTGALGALFSKKFDIKEANRIGKEDINKFVLKIAKYDIKRKGEDDSKIDLSSAISYLENNYKLSSDCLTPEFGGGLQHHLRDFSHHPSMIGFLFSMLTQVTGYGFGTNTEGKFIFRKIPENYYIGKTTKEKVFNGTFCWLMHLVSDMAGSSSSVGNGADIVAVSRSLGHSSIKITLDTYSHCLEKNNDELLSILEKTSPNLLQQK